jgi:DNA replication factor GINS
LESKTDSLYNELFSRWKDENNNKELNPIPRDYYRRVGEQIRRLRDLLPQLDQKSTKSVLLRMEIEQTRKILRDLVTTRRLKILEFASEGKTVSIEDLTREDEVLYRNILSAINSYDKETKRSFEGDIEHNNLVEEDTPKRILVRFLRDIPAIVGSDMRTYGPFKIEDVATLPVENATALMKQGFAIEVEARKDEGA